VVSTALAAGERRQAAGGKQVLSPNPHRPGACRPSPRSWGDSVEKACQAGVAAIAHPGGSMRDQDCIDCCNKYGVALVTTGVRHFKH
jgi:hypothetical protein